MTRETQNRRLQLFLRYRSYWAAGLLLGWMLINIAILATSKLMESQREGKSLPASEPWCWEISSNLMVLLLIPVEIYLHDRWFTRFEFKTRFLLHTLTTL